MKKKFSKNKKIILLISGLGILTTSIVTPILVINNKNKKNKQFVVDSNTKKNSENLKKVNKIIAKIKDKDILIAPNVSTQNQSEIQNAIKNQLKKENQILNEDVLSKIIINIKSLTLGKKVKINLIIKVRNTTKELTIKVEKISLLKSSNINNGESGTIFQDSFKNLWTMVKLKKLQVLKANDSKDGYVSSGWTNDDIQGLLKSSNINNGEGGTIFQDSFKNLWTMGNETKLQVLKVNSEGNGYENAWVNNNDKNIGHELLKNSNIGDSRYETIFQDSFKNLWAMSSGKPLQVLKANSNGDGYVTTGWTIVTTKELLKGSNIIDGNSGQIFQDKFKNLWAMGNGTKLQVLKVNYCGNGYVSGGWTNNNAEGLLKNSNINNGYIGKIFQDSFKNLWAMSKLKKLQVLKANLNGNGYTSKGWTNDINRGLLNGSNINNGFGGTIFQDKFKNLWATGRTSPLQVLKVKSDGSGYVNEGWTNDSTHELLKGSNIIDGLGAIIFQDSFKNLWATGYKLSLQIIKTNSNGDGYVTTGWTNNIDTEKLLNNSNIIDGYFATIFQDLFKNLWAMGVGTPLQVLMTNSDGDGYINSWL